jgi:DUF883 C-terminal glycine zipper region
MPKHPASAADPIEVEIPEPESDESDEPLLDKLEEFGNHVTDFVVQRPLAAVGIALATGFLLGRLMR